ncbi:hypothetical protein LCGC14_1881760 [marine sediment metagenome]|uniref:Uncharacterized protein n=1 Tax=marine sediment metagenome TaxID=412755 RepID=A0A0F9IG14_9ZZZZ
MNYKKLIEKYMLDVTVREGTPFVDDTWTGGSDENDYTEKEHAFLVELREKVWNKYCIPTVPCKTGVLNILRYIMKKAK